MDQSKRKDHAPCHDDRDDLQHVSPYDVGDLVREDGLEFALRHLRGETAPNDDEMTEQSAHRKCVLLHTLMYANVEAGNASAAREIRKPSLKRLVADIA